jgi:HPt (histidine-containing phosphotransfer) domain-containing protein
MDPAPIDRDVVDELMTSLGDDFVRELVATFLAEAPAMLGELRRSLAGTDADAFRRAAHTLKSNALAFGAEGLAARAKALEHGGLAQAGAGALDELEGEYRRVAQALEERTRE